MEWREAARMTWAHLTSHKLRVVLTVIGVTVGVASVVAVVTMGESVKGTVAQEFSVFDSNMMVGCVGVKEERRAYCERGSTVFTEYDVDNVRNLERTQAAAPLGLIPTTRIEHEGETRDYGAVVASGQEIFPTIGATIGQGRTYENGEMEVVIGNSVQGYFGSDNPVEVGDELTIFRRDGLPPHRVTVVGILEPTRIGQYWYGYDQAIYAPVDPFYQQRTVSPNTGLPMPVYAEILTRARSQDQVDATADQMRDYFREDSDARELKADNKDFVVLSARFIREAITGQIETFTTFIAAVAAISLLSGGIGILNIMLVGAVERTREIGIMKAVGARRRDILQMFAFESASLGLLGGLVGLGVGLVLSQFVVDYIAQVTDYAVPLVIPIAWLPMTLAIGVGIGLVAGVFPAWKAATVDPVEALRYE